MAKWSNIYSWQNHFHLLLNAGNNCYVNVKSIEADNGSNFRFEYEKCLFLQPFKPLLYPLANSLKWCPYIFLFHVMKVNTYCSRPAKDIGPGRCPLWIPCPSASKYTLSESSVDCLPTPTPHPHSGKWTHSPMEILPKNAFWSLSSGARAVTGGSRANGLLWGGSAPRSNPRTFIFAPFIDKWYPFHISGLKGRILFNRCNFTVF